MRGADVSQGSKTQSCSAGQESLVKFLVKGISQDSERPVLHNPSETAFDTGQGYPLYEVPRRT